MRNANLIALPTLRRAFLFYFHPSGSRCQKQREGRAWIPQIGGHWLAWTPKSRRTISWLRAMYCRLLHPMQMVFKIAIIARKTEPDHRKATHYHNRKSGSRESDKNACQSAILDHGIPIQRF